MLISSVTSSSTTPLKASAGVGSSAPTEPVRAADRDEVQRAYLSGGLADAKGLLSPSTVRDVIGFTSTSGPTKDDRISSEDRAFFRGTTGYNFVTYSDGGHKVLDDDGNPPKVSLADADAMGLLGISLMGDRSSSYLTGDASPDWLKNFMATYADSDFAVPKDWQDKAADWFLTRG